MDLHASRGFNPLSGLEIKEAICASVRQELDKNTDFESHISWPVVKWKVHLEVEYATNPQAEPLRASLEVQGEHITTDQEGTPRPLAPVFIYSSDIEEDVEYPGLIRDRFLQSPAVVGPMVAPLSPVQAKALEADTRPEHLAPARRRPGRPKGS